MKRVGADDVVMGGGGSFCNHFSFQPSISKSSFVYLSVVNYLSTFPNMHSVMCLPVYLYINF